MERNAKADEMLEILEFLRDNMLMRGELPAREELLTRADAADFARKDDFKDFITKEDAKTFATKDDLKHFAIKDDLKHFVVKDDLKSFATKDDLKNFATKDDLKRFATKVDLKQLATREEMKGELKRFATKEDFQRLETDLDKLTMKVLDMDAKMDHFTTKQDLAEMKHEIFGIVDGFINTQRTFEVEQAALRHKFDRHEDRLGVIEKRPGIS